MNTNEDFGFEKKNYLRLSECVHNEQPLMFCTVTTPFLEPKN